MKILHQIYIFFQISFSRPFKSLQHPLPELKNYEGKRLLPH